MLRWTIPAAVGMLVLTSAASAPQDNAYLELGSPAPGLVTGQVFGHVGRELSLENLRGHVVLLQFWQTDCEPCRQVWPKIDGFQNAFGDRGLIVLGLSSEAAEKVSGRIDAWGLRTRQAAQSRIGVDYGIRTIPSTYVLDAQGNVAWAGPSNDLSEGIVETIVRGATRKAWNPLTVPSIDEVPARLASLARALDDGKLAPALKGLPAILADEKANDDDKHAAQSLKDNLDTHLELLTAQIDTLLAGREVRRALVVLDALAKELGADERGVQAKTRAAEVRKDPASMQEIAAEDALDKAIEGAARAGETKTRQRYEELTRKYKGTRAAERAAALLGGDKKP